MKRSAIFLIAILITSVSFSQDAYQQRQERTAWFRDARFGMFIHWGIYAIPARGEWVQSNEEMPKEDYQSYFENFNPVDYNPRQWAQIAKEAGMKYAVLTAKHHDGFCLFDSEYTEFKATNTPANRDLIAEYVEAFREAGIKVGFYYSLIDWNHPDYPNVGNHPMRNNEAWSKKKYNWDNYLTYMHNQVEELVTNYGKIDIMWFDYSFGEYSGEKWKATELVQMVRKHQPHIIIDNRLGGEMTQKNAEVYAGDFEGPEQIIPYDQVRDEEGRPIPWEACITLNNDWGYSKDDHFKSPRDLVRTLVNCVSKGGNLLLNVGPDARGNIPEESKEVLAGIGEWMELNQASIYNCGPADFPKPEWGRYTQDGKILYAHLMDFNVGQYYLRGLKGKIKRATLLRDGSEVQVADFWLGDKPFVEEEDVFISLGKPLQHTFPLPDHTDTVVKIELK